MLLLLNTNEGVDCLKYLLSNWQNRCPVLKDANWQITMEKEHLIMQSSHKTGTSPSERSEAFTNNQVFLIVKKGAVNQKNLHSRK